MSTLEIAALEPRTLAARLEEARRNTDAIFALLTPEALYERPIPERHRLVFYLGHLEAFDWNLVARQAHGLEAFDAAFDQLFAFGIDPIGGGLPNEPASDWPERGLIAEYNRRVREGVDACLAGKHRIADGHDLPTIASMAIEHRLMHAETLAYLLHHLPFDAKRAVRDPEPPSVADLPGATRIEIPAGRATLGRSRAKPGFGWDNEFEESVVPVPAFAIDRDKVSNARFLEFVRDGGYRRRELWSDADWEWIERDQVRHPGFWREAGGEWRYRGMFAEQALPLDRPAYVSQAEAAAFARWLKGALPSEAQFHRAAYATEGGEEREYPWGAEAPTARRGNFDFQRWEPAPIGAYPDGRSALGVSELVGNGWEWTSSLFEPFPGFRPHPFYAGYSANFFDGHHFVLKGGSPRTAACMLRRSFRNWFQPHYPYLYATFRLIAA
ncbi:MAG TPA: SUMF1/EgtB/PvdO family nonheme iron enzyme [Candidatus Udaeobacter sp.]|jgi:ergothioneine biosynthesis protein EgtB|nr:SUMF1/EgtB/PvdO family nonheme iron enzyme [Candidatus Udaeobacter sp.]